MKIIELILIKKKATQTRKNLKDEYKPYNFKIRIIFKTMNYMRKFISENLYNI